MLHKLGFKTASKNNKKILDKPIPETEDGQTDDLASRVFSILV